MKKKVKIEKKAEDVVRKSFYAHDSQQAAILKSKTKYVFFRRLFEE